MTRSVVLVRRGVIAAAILLSACAGPSGAHSADRLAPSGGAATRSAQLVGAARVVPAGFVPSEFAMADPFGGWAVGGVALPRATCRPVQIMARAATRRTADGVLGVVRLRGAVVAHRYGGALRCALPITRGPAVLIAADGRALNVPLSGGDATSPPSNPRPDIALDDGDAVWGFAWFGSYCGAPAAAIAIPLRHTRGRLLRVPLRGPQPRCDPNSVGSALIDGVAGHPGQPAQPARPAYSDLRLTGQIEPGTTRDRLAPIDLTLATTGTNPVTLDPCPAYAGRDNATARSGGFGDPISSGHLPCTDRGLVIRPGQPLNFTVSATSLVQTPGTGAVPGSTVYVLLGIAGVPLLHLATTAHR